MIRVEIIANHSVEENILEAFSREEVGKYYTKYPNVFGVGSSGPRMGDAVWPEENFSLVIWCEEEEARGIVRAVAAVKKQFPDEGIRIFGIPAESNRFSHVTEYTWVPPAVHIEGGASIRTASQAPAVPPQPVHLPQTAPAAPVQQDPVQSPAAAPQPAPQASQPASAASQAAPAAPQPVHTPPQQQTAPAAYTPPPQQVPLQTAAPPPPPVYTTVPSADPEPETGPDSTIGKEYDGQNMEN
jgi:hypothetical protein